MKFRKQLVTFFLLISIIFGSIPVQVYGAEDVQEKDNETIIYEFLRGELGLNIAASCGILANICAESNFNPLAYNGNDSGGTISYGICQWNNGAGAGNRYGKLIDWCAENGYAYDSLEGQLQFMKYELQEGENYRYYKYTKLKDEIENSPEGAYEASKIWSVYYEGCAVVFREKRAELAKRTYWEKYKKELMNIVVQPVNVTVNEGEQATVSVEASGEELLYSWYYKKQGETEFQCAATYSTNSYAVEVTAETAGQQVYCIVSDKYGNTMQTDTVVLDYYRELTILEQPEDVKVVSGKQAKVKVTAEGNGLTYKWYYKDQGKSEFKLANSYKKAAYFIKMNDKREGRQVYCVVTDERGNTVQTETVTLYMKREAKITEQPVGVKAAEGTKAKVSVAAEGDGLIYKWYYKNAGSTKFYQAKSFTGSTYSVKMNEKRAGQKVYCVITDEYGNSVKTNTVTLKMRSELKITSQPKGVKVAEGKTAKVKVTAQGDGLTYKWYYKNAGSTKFYQAKSFTGSTYSVKMNEKRAGQKVYCVITDEYGNSVKTNTVTLKMRSELKITSQPKGVKVAEGKTAKVKVTAQGDGLTYKWYYKNAGAAKYTYAKSVKGAVYSVEMSKNRAGRKIYCVITDEYGNSVKTNVVTLKMK